MGKAYGSGHFGQWIEDEFGLPAFEYNCNQVTDPRAAAPTNPALRQPNDHTFLFGNDRIIALASNFGYVQVRQDEGGPKLLNDYRPAVGRYGGGIGYLADGGEVLGTWYDGKNEDFQRIYGIGYMKKTVRNGKYEVKQCIYAPFGDDPVLISEVDITNLSGRDASPEWYEYWGAKLYPLSFRAILLQVVTGKGSLDFDAMQGAPRVRYRLSDAFRSAFTAIEGGKGLAECKKFTGWGIDKFIWKKVRDGMRAVSDTNSSYYCPELDRMEDIHPPSTFLYCLSDTPDGYMTDGQRFFGGDVSRPAGIGSRVKGKKSPAVIARKKLDIAAGQTRRLTFLYGYVPEGFTMSGLIQKYSAGYTGILQDNAERWKAGKVSLSVMGKPWIEREMVWHNAYLRQSLSYDSYFQGHILSQGNVYQYLMGFQGAARDPLQHTLPFIFSNPSITREVIRYTLKEVLPDGEIPYGIVGHGCIMPSPFISSDFELWLLWTVAEYILGTKDTAFLGELVVPYPFKGVAQQPQTVMQLLKRCYIHFTELTSEGGHGLSKLLHGDWNDNIVIGSTSPEARDDIRTQGESVLVGAFAAYVLDYYADMLDMLGDADAGDARRKAAGQREAVKGQWNGKWFRRAYLSDALGWVGDDMLWLEPQPWAILSGAAEGRELQLLKSINELVRTPSPIGAMLMSRSIANIDSAPGNLTNAGVWPSINGTLIKALAMIDPGAAWDEWQKNTLAAHAEAYPDEWTGTWSAADCYNSVLAEYPGNTAFTPDRTRRESGFNWTDFPVLNLHPHAWPLYNASDFVVQRFTGDGVVLNPRLPEKAYRFDSPLLTLSRDSEGYSGCYAPVSEKENRIVLILPPNERTGRLTIGGNDACFEAIEGGITFSVSSRQRWAWTITVNSKKT